MTEELKHMKQRALHQAAAYFEDVVCYDLKEIMELNDLQSRLRWGKCDEETEKELADRIFDRMNRMKKLSGAPQRIYLWEDGNMPSLNTYTENPELRFNHDPDFKPYMYEMLIPENETPKGAFVVCAGGDHGDANLHEGYQTCIDLNRLGYQCFMLLNRVNRCPYDEREAGADASRAIRMVRSRADRYRIDENNVAFAGFSNGGLTAEACIRYFSGTQTVRTHFPDYRPDGTDRYYGSPDAVVCVYGPRFRDSHFDYTNVVYPPTFFAVGRDDFAMENLEAVIPDLRAHNVEVEVHTFAGVPHGQSGVTIYGNYDYPHFQLWLQLADAFVQNVFSKAVVKRTPDVIADRRYRFDSFSEGEVLFNRKKNHLPAMGWNSWNAFGTGNTEKLTMAMADALVELKLDELGYRYVVLDDGCYKPVRSEGRLANEPVKFPNDFKVISDYIHEKGLKFGMYNDIGIKLCSGLNVGTCGHEETDAQSYVDWGVDYLKVDNCYYLFDNATFSDSSNAKYVFAPNIRGIRITGDGFERVYTAEEGEIKGAGIFRKNGYVTNIGTFDGTAPLYTPVGDMSGELVFDINTESHISAEAGGSSEAVRVNISVEYATAMTEGVGSWLQLAVGEGEAAYLYDDFLPSTESEESFRYSEPIEAELVRGRNIIRIMNHRRQENTLCSYAELLKNIQKLSPDNDIIFSLCEWGKTQPQNWGYKVGDSWRILNDITFRVGADGDPGHGVWQDDYTTSVTSQYNKAVIMDEFAGLDKGWNDPDMLMIGMEGLTETMYKTHMTMWCMMNAPLMLGLDLRRLKEGDALYKIIANRELIALNQDALGIQAKRVYSSMAVEAPDKEYIRETNRVDILVKPLADGSIAVSFINVSESESYTGISLSVDRIYEMLGKKLVNPEVFKKAEVFRMKNLWSGEEKIQAGRIFTADKLEPCENITFRVFAGEQQT